MDYLYNDKGVIEAECRKAGFDVRTDSSVIYAKCNSQEEGDRFTQFLLSKWGKESNGILKLPFSYGFCIVKAEDKAINRADLEREQEYEERDL